jgi:hypothetical protein
MVCRCIAFATVPFGTVVTRLRNAHSVPEEWDESHKNLSRISDLLFGIQTMEFFLLVRVLGVGRPV